MNFRLKALDNEVDRIWSRAYSNLNSVVDQQEIPTGETLVDNLVLYAQSLPEYDLMFESLADAERSAREWLKNSPFVLGK